MMMMMMMMDRREKSVKDVQREERRYRGIER